MSACCLCSTRISPVSKEPWNRPLYQTSNFCVLPSLGSLVAGWLLIVPKRHFICMGALSPGLRQELDDLKRRVGAVVRRRYGQVCVFEHGPSRPNHSIGCSVDHAHLHLVPITFDLVDAARSHMPVDAAWGAATLDDCCVAYAKGSDYLYIEQPMGSGLIAVHSNFGSQVFRKAIAARLGRPGRFNWREYPEVDVVARTVSDFASSRESINLIGFPDAT